MFDGTIQPLDGGAVPTAAQGSSHRGASSLWTPPRLALLGSVLAFLALVAAIAFLESLRQELVSSWVTLLTPFLTH